MCLVLAHGKLMAALYACTPCTMAQHMWATLSAAPTDTHSISDPLMFYPFALATINDAIAVEAPDWLHATSHLPTAPGAASA